jgi:hypothetical protein
LCVEDNQPDCLDAIDLQPNNGSNLVAAEDQVAPREESFLAWVARARGLGDGGLDRTEVDTRPTVLVERVAGGTRPGSRPTGFALHWFHVWISIAGSTDGSDALELYSGAGDREMALAFAETREASRFQVLLNDSPEQPVDESPVGVGGHRPQVVTVPLDNERRIACFAIFLRGDRWIQPAASGFPDGAVAVVFMIPRNLLAREQSPGSLPFEGRTDRDRLPELPHVIQVVTTILATATG